MSERRRYQLWNYDRGAAVASELMTAEEAEGYNAGLRAASANPDRPPILWLAAAVQTEGAQSTATGSRVVSYAAETPGAEIVTLQGVLRVYECPNCGRGGVLRRGPDLDQVVSHTEGQLPGGFEFIDYCAGGAVALVLKTPPGARK